MTFESNHGLKQIKFISTKQQQQRSSLLSRKLANIHSADDIQSGKQIVMRQYCVSNQHAVWMNISDENTSCGECSPDSISPKHLSLTLLLRKMYNSALPHLSRCASVDPVAVRAIVFFRCRFLLTKLLRLSCSLKPLVRQGVGPVILCDALLLLTRRSS